MRQPRGLSSGSTCSERIAGTDADLFHLAGRVARSRQPRPRLFQYGGTADFLYADNLRFRDHAQSLKLDLTYREDGGSHGWAYWDVLILAFLNWITTPE